MTDSTGATERDHADAQPVWKVVRQHASSRVNSLQRDYLRGGSSAKADLAELRRADPTDEQQLLEAWETVFVDPPAALIGYGDAPTRAERVLVATAHLYAVHQQSKSEPMHVEGVGLGTALRRLANPSDAGSREKPVMRRYHSLTTATEFAEILHHLRGLVSQMRAEGIKLDYSRIASDLYLLQDERTRTRVRLTWARDLVRPAKKTELEA